MNALPESAGFCRQLCEAVEFRWAPERLFVMFTAFMDESGTHADAPSMYLAAALGTGRQWELFERRVRGLQREFGFKVFHSKNFRAQSGEFAGWSNEKRRRFLLAFVRLFGGLAHSFTIELEKERYLREYRDKWAGSKTPFDSQFGLCFRHVLQRLLTTLSEYGPQHLLHIVIEDGHQNIGGAVNIFNEVKDEALGGGLRILGDITIAKKSERIPLMAADFLAYVSFASDRDQDAGWRPEGGRGNSALDVAQIRLKPSAFDVHHKWVEALHRNRRVRKRKQANP